MTFSVDTNVILDILLADPRHGLPSRRTLEEATAQGQLIICPLVYAELAPLFPNPQNQDEALGKMGIRLKPFTKKTLHLAGTWWRDYLTKRGKRKERILADFLIAAFAQETSHALITRDTFFQRYVEIFYLS